jgi:hypothetical protein
VHLDVVFIACSYSFKAETGIKKHRRGATPNENTLLAHEI